MAKKEWYYIHKTSGKVTRIVKIGADGTFVWECGRWVERPELRAIAEKMTDYEQVSRKEAARFVTEMMNEKSNQVMQALRIAMRAHDGQTDKAGMPYILHPLTVALAQETEEAFVAGLLHDVVEDSDYTFDDMKHAGISDEIISSLRLLTHDKSVPYMEYIAAIKNNRIATAVKLADLAHNTDLSRLPVITDKDRARVKKYEHAKGYLKGERGFGEVMTEKEYFEAFGKMWTSRQNDIIYAVNCKVPKAEAGLRDEVESIFYDRLMKEAEAHEEKYGSWPVFEMGEIEYDDPRLDIYSDEDSEEDSELLTLLEVRAGDAKPTYEEFCTMVKESLREYMPELSERQLEDYMNKEDTVTVIKNNYELDEKWLAEGKLTVKIFRNGSVSSTAHCLYMMY